MHLRAKRKKTFQKLKSEKILVEALCPAKFEVNACKSFARVFKKDLFSAAWNQYNQKIMNIVETIQHKVIQLSPQAQNEVLEIVEKIEERYQNEIKREHLLTKIAKMTKDIGVTDFAEKHDSYANGKLEDWSILRINSPFLDTGYIYALNL